MRPSPSRPSTMPKRTSAADATPVRVVIVTLDSHLASAVERAERTLRKDLPGLALRLHAAADMGERSGGARALPRRHREGRHRGRAPCCSWRTTSAPVLAALEARRDRLRRDGRAACRPARSIRLTRIGRFRMDGPQSGAMALLKRLRGSKARRRKSGAPGAQQMAMLRRLPQHPALHSRHRAGRARLLPHPAVLARGLRRQHREMVRLLVDRYADGPRKALRGTLKPALPVEYPEVGLYHPRLKGRIADAAEKLPRVAGHARHGRRAGDALLRAGGQHRALRRRDRRARGARPARRSGVRERPRRASRDRALLHARRRAHRRRGGVAHRLLAGRRPRLQRRHAPPRKCSPQLDVPYIAAQPVEFQTLEQWADADRGLLPVEATMMVAIPELDGATGPMVFGGRADPRASHAPAASAAARSRSDRSRDMRPAPSAPRCSPRASTGSSRCAAPSARARKVAIVLFNFPPNAGSTGTAAYLSRVRVAAPTRSSRMHAAGYTVDVAGNASMRCATRIIDGQCRSASAPRRTSTRASRPTITSAASAGCPRSRRSGVPRRAGSRPTAQSIFVLGAQFGNVLRRRAARRSATKATRCACCSRRASRRRTPSRPSTATCARTSAPTRCCTSAPTARWSSCPASRPACPARAGPTA